jgi:pyruvate dehydrogenase E1 component
VILNQCLRAQGLLAEKFGVAADVWSATSYKQLRREALACERWNTLHPAEPPRQSYLETLLAQEAGVFVAASDYMKALPEMIQKWVPGGLLALGTDGFGRSDDRPDLRRHFEIDAECIAAGALPAGTAPGTETATGEAGDRRPWDRPGQGRPGAGVRGRLRHSAPAKPQAARSI